MVGGAVGVYRTGGVPIGLALAAGIIRTPLDPDTTYSDDPLRMIRAIRFATQLGFTIVPESLESIKRNKERRGVITLPSGLQYKIEKMGTGAKAKVLRIAICIPFIPIPPIIKEFILTKNI